MSEPQATKAASYEARFVQALIQRCQQDKGLAARLRRADNPATEDQSWDFLIGLGTDLEPDLAYRTVSAALARAKVERNGSLKLGRAIANCYSDGNQSDQAQAKLRRVLACDDLPELCRVLRPVLTLIDSRVDEPLDFVDLLMQLRSFAYGGDSAQRVKAHWAQSFYGKQAYSDANREDCFVQALVKSCQEDKGLAARLRRADNPATEDQSWDFLASFGINLETPYQRLPYITVAAALAKAKADKNGSLKLGRAIANCYSDGSKSDQAQAKLRRVLACDDLPELCRVLRPVLALIDSRVAQPLDFVDLLTQLRRFGNSKYPDNAQWVKARWAQSFYGKQADSAAQMQEAVA